jgi:DNA-binding CsgD family transcriptional regulator
VLDRASEVHHFALVAKATTLPDALAHAATNPSAPASVALRAIERAFHSDIRGAISLLRQALRSCSEPADAAYFTDLLAQNLASTGDFQGLESVLQACTVVPDRLAPSMCAMTAILHAVRGDVETSRSLARQSMTAIDEAAPPELLAQVLNRSSLAAYYRGDYAESEDLALRAALLLESCGAFWCAGASYSVPATIAQDWNQDGRAAAAHYSRMLKLAEDAGHSALRRVAIAGLFSVAAEMFDEPAHTAMRKLLVARPEAQQLQENYAVAVADALGFGWKGEFAAAEAVLAACAARIEVSQQQRALVEALLGLIGAANGDVELARALARAALKRTVRSSHEPLFERRLRALARQLAAAACFIIGDTVRGLRGLSERFDPGRKYRNLLITPPIDLFMCSDVFRGYAEFVNVVSRHARAHRPQLGLTPTEADLLRMLPQGTTLVELASDMKKSKHTVARQVESIYQKLGVHNRAQAVQKARALGLVP